MLLGGAVYHNINTNTKNGTINNVNSGAFTPLTLGLIS